MRHRWATDFLFVPQTVTLVGYTVLSRVLEVLSTIVVLDRVSYIKEFVHGDFGRTQPDLGSLLGVDCDILELDVEVCIYVF